MIIKRLSLLVFSLFKMLRCFKTRSNFFLSSDKMGTIETVLFIFGVLLVVIIVAMLVRIYYVIEQHGVQIAVLLKHEKEGFVPWRNRAVAQNYSSHYRQNLLPENKQLTPPGVGNMISINNQRAQRPCQALSTEQLKRYGAVDASRVNAALAAANEEANAAAQMEVVEKPKDGLAEHAAKAEELNITTEDSLKTGNLSSMDVDVSSNYVADEGAAVDQTGVVQDTTTENQTESFRMAMASGNHRIVPQFLGSMTEGFKQGNESFKSRYRATHRGQHNF